MRIRGGEIDLIMLDRFTWVFVEVRYHRCDSYGTAAESVTPRKRRRLLRGAQVWRSAAPDLTPPLAVSILSPLPEAGLND